MPSWLRTKHTVLISCGLVCGSLFLTHPGIAAVSDEADPDQCGSAGATADAAAEDYVKKPAELYTLEQPFGGVSQIEDIGQYIQLVYQFALGIIGIFATVLIMFGGVMWIQAAGNEQKITEAKEIITSAIAGLIIALLSYTLLTFINPQILSTDVSIYKIPIQLECSFPPPPVEAIPTLDGLSGNGATMCPKAIADLQEVVTKMRTDTSYIGYCPNCTIQIGNAYRTPESQEPLYECYTKCVEEGYIEEGGTTPRLKDGTPDGCSACNKAAKPCCSNHNHGNAMDIWLSTGSGDTLLSDKFTQSYNNGGKGGSVQIVGSYNCASTTNPDMCNKQYQLQKIITGTNKFTAITLEWWHFDYYKPEVCVVEGEFSCSKSSTTGFATEYFCRYDIGGGGSVNYYAQCETGVASCTYLSEASYIKSDWTISAGCAAPQEVYFPPEYLRPSPIDQYDYYQNPTCRYSPDLSGW